MCRKSHEKCVQWFSARQTDRQAGRHGEANTYVLANFDLRTRPSYNLPQGSNDNDGLPQSLDSII